MENSELLGGFSADSFTAFDVETTGLDPEKDEIIEIGVVRMQSGRIIAKNQQLFHPSVPIPSHITKLTGIRNADCEDKPPLSQKIPEILQWLDDRWIIAHNADFDYSFLSNAVRRFCPEAGEWPRSRILDTLDLSRIVLPFLQNHRLDTLVESFHIPFQPSHRALADAEAAAWLFHRLLPQLLELDIHTIRIFNRILNGAPDGLRLFFNGLEAVKGRVSGRARTAAAFGPSNVLGVKSPAKKTESPERVSVDALSDFFSPGGTLSRLVPDYEARKPQLDMAKMAARAMNEDAFLVCEAGTGIGKTLAYLVPALLWAGLNSGQKVIVSTHTKTLQDQLFFKDLPLLQKGLPDPFSAVLLKGRSNYLCLARWENLIEHLDERLDLEHRRKLLPLVLWINATRTGDIEENATFSKESNEDVWQQINCETGHCRGRECAHEPRCFLQNVRKASRCADLVVVNHSLLFSTLNLPASVLGDYDTLIMDEAHQIEKTASQYLGSSLSEGAVHDLAHWMYRAKPQETGFLFSLSGALKSNRFPKGVRMKAGQALHKLKTLTMDIHGAAADLFQALDGHFFKQQKHKFDRSKTRIRQADDLLRAASKEMEQLRNLLSDARQEWKALAGFFVNEAFEGPNDNPETAREIESVLARLESMLGDLELFICPDMSGRVVWCERVERRSKREITLFSVPVDIGGTLAKRLYPRIKRGVFTSATLAVGERFEYIMGRWGLNRVEPDRILTQILGSPFDYTRQVLFLIPTFLSNPKEEPFIGQLSSMLSRILTEQPRGALILFTSHSALKQVYESVRPSLEARGIRMLGQGIDGSRTAVLRMFQQDVKSVLFGTSSFWEGVDIPGQALEMLVITRIPFDVPTEPLFEARMERVQERTGNAFFQYAVPEALVRFRQGFGRLIRTCSDRGVVLLTDLRAVQTAYGPLFSNSLPVEATLCKDENALLSHLNHWFSS
jgi:predicted DnaQ family exonuclease/DinG family helicase